MGFCGVFGYFATMQIWSRIISAWGVLEHWALHPGLYEDASETRKARLMLACSVIAGPPCMAIIIFGYLTATQDAMSHLAVGVGHFLVCSTWLSLRYFPTTKIPTTIIAVITNIHMMSAVFFSGGSDSAVLLAVPLATVFLGLLGGRWHSLATGLFMSFGVIAIFAMGDAGLVFGAGLSTEDVYLGTLVWSIMTGTLIAVYTHIQTDHLLKQASDEVERRRAAQEEAERANRAKGLFMAYLSHEIRNPLAVIMGSADMMRLTEDESRQQRHLDTMRVASHGLSNLLDDVIDFASLEQDQLVVRREHLSLQTLVQQIVDLYAITAEQKGLSLHFSCIENAEVVADDGRLRQVLTNLISNAIKFTESGGIEVRIEREQSRMKLTVEDSGLGIPEDQRAHIFDPFSRGEPGSVPGRGLGLTVCQGLLRRMDSELLLVSSKSGGSEFHFSLPIVEPSSEVAGSDPKDRRSVLVVDDNETVAQLLAEQIRQLDCDVRVCLSGEDALNMMEMTMPDVVLLDVNMPDMRGEVVAQNIEEKWGTDSTEIWFVTANPLSEVHGIGAGMLIKPVDTQKLQALIRSV